MKYMKEGETWLEKLEMTWVEQIYSFVYITYESWWMNLPSLQ